MMEKLMGRGRKGMGKILNIQGNPKKIAGGFAVGWMIGFTPFVGIQVFLSMAAAGLLRLNKTAAVLAVFNTNVVSGLFIFSINYSIGTSLLGLEPTFAFPDHLGIGFLKQVMYSGYEVALSLVLGGIITGIPTSLGVYFTILYLFEQNQKKHGRSY